ncbi:hypothetical protein AHAS_Ahas18G0191800 [Arachis hypogaea]
MSKTLKFGVAKSLLFDFYDSYVWDPKSENPLERGKEKISVPLPNLGDPHSYTRRVNTDQRLDQVLAEICVEGAQWRRDAQGKPYQLGRLDLKPVARGWLEFIQHSIIPTSNCSEVTIDRAIMNHCIMLGNEVEVHEVISQELYKVADKPSTQARLAFPHLICHLCNSAGIVIKGDIPIEEDKPITKRRIEHTREPTHGPQQEHVQPPPPEIFEIPQGMYFSSQDYWEKLNTFLGELSSNVD